MYNRETQVIYTSSDSVIVANYGWMMADVVPLNTCSYIVSQSTSVSGASLLVKYNFEQWVMSVQANSDLQQRAVMLRQNYAKTFTVTTSSAITDVIRNGEKVFWYPYWGAFYWVSYGKLILKIDLGYSTADADVVNPSLDPCQTTSPIFKCTSLSDASCIKHVSMQVGTVSAAALNYIIDHVWVYKFMYVVVAGNNNKIVYKVSGNPRATGATGTLSISSYMTFSTSSTVTIRSMQSLEQFGFYLTSYDSSTSAYTVNQYQLDMTVITGTTTLATDSNGDYVENTAGRVMTTKTYTDPTYNQRMMQQSSFMYQNRPIYSVIGKSSDLVTYRDSIFEYTSFLQTPALFVVPETAGSRELDLY